MVTLRRGKRGIEQCCTRAVRYKMTFNQRLEGGEKANQTMRENRKCQNWQAYLSCGTSRPQTESERKTGSGGESRGIEESQIAQSLISLPLVWDFTLSDVQRYQCMKSGLDIVSSHTPSLPIFGDVCQKKKLLNI